MAARYDSTALIDSAFRDYFDRIIREYSIIEYYLVDGTVSFITVDRFHQIYQLWTLDDGLIDMYLCSKPSENLSQQQQ